MDLSKHDTKFEQVRIDQSKARDFDQFQFSWMESRFAMFSFVLQINKLGRCERYLGKSGLIEKATAAIKKRALITNETVAEIAKIFFFPLTHGRNIPNYNNRIKICFR